MFFTMTEQVIDGKYRVVSVLGKGGYGTVYKAQQIGMNRFVAVKVLDASALGSQESKARFQREAKVLCALSHPNIVSIYSLGFEEHGRPYIAMQFLPGKTLAALSTENGKLPWRHAVRLAMQTCRGLAAAHRAGVV